MIDAGAVDQNGAFFYSIGEAAMNVPEIDPAMAVAAMNSATALSSPKTEVPWAACEARPTKVRMRSMRDAIRKTILQVDPWLVDQLGEVEQQQQETLRRIAVMMQPAVALHLKSEEGHCE